MKVSELIRRLNTYYKPDDELCVLYWDKPCLEEELSTESWSAICAEFDDWEEAGGEISEWIADAVNEYTHPSDIDVDEDYNTPFLQITKEQS